MQPNLKFVFLKDFFNLQTKVNGCNIQLMTQLSNLRKLAQNFLLLSAQNPVIVLKMMLSGAGVCWKCNFQYKFYIFRHF